MPSSLTFHQSIKILIWLFGLGTLTALTIRDFLPILNEYRTNNVAIQVDVRVDDRFKAPRMVVCLPFYKKKHEDLLQIVQHLVNGTGKCEICQKLEHVGWDIWNRTDLKRYAEDGIETLYNALTIQYMNELFKDIDNEKNVLSSEFSSWNHPILTAVMNFFIWQELKDYTFQQYDFGDSFGHEFLQKLDSFTDKQKMDLLYSRVLESICETIVFKESFLSIDYEPMFISNMTCRDLLMGQDTPTTFDLVDGLWFSLPAQKSPRVQLKQYTFSLLENGFFTWKAKESKKRPIVFYPDPSATYVSQVDPMYVSFIDKVTQEKDSVSVSIRYGVNMRAMERRPRNSQCQNDTILTCFSKCTKLWVADKCGCIVFTYKKGVPHESDLPYYTYAMYSACNISTVPDLVRDICLVECNNVCEHMAYNWAVSHKGFEVEDAVNRSELILLMHPLVTTFADFSWVYKATPEQFMSQMGGIVNFYLGFSGLSIFASLLVVVDFFKRWKSTNERDCMGTAKEAALDMCQQTEDKSLKHWMENVESELKNLKGLILELKHQNHAKF